jgi:hypothetical protein
MKSARRSRTPSSVPEASPAATMLTYRLPKTLGCGSSALARELPSFRRSTTCVSTRLSSRFSTCSVSAPTASTSGMPAITSVASWRVIIATSPTVLRPPAFAFASSSALVRRMPSRFRTARRTLALSASRMP